MVDTHTKYTYLPLTESTEKKNAYGRWQGQIFFSSVITGNLELFT